MLETLFKEQQTLVNDFFDRIDLEQTDALLQLLLACKGTIIFTGVGKSGIVAKKIAMTMLSTGTKAFYLSPMNALHGDIGIVTADDVFVILGKSGESEELLSLIPFVRNKGASLVSIACNEKCRVGDACDFHLNLPLKKELCPFDLAPTTSAGIQLLFGDVMVIAMMQAKQYSLDQYAGNHPAGRIGKRMVMKVTDLMITGENIPFANPEDKVVDTLVTLSDKRCGCLIVVDENQAMLGIFTDGDLRRALQERQEDVLNVKVGSLMTSNPKQITSDQLAWDAMKLMESNQKHPIMVLPVIDNNSVVGIIKMHDLIQAGI
jgi:arabinose-5-phosphate isomerase